MIFQTFQTLNEFGNQSEGLHVLFLYVVNIVPIFIPLTLFVFFCIIMFGTFFAQQRLVDNGDFASSFAVAGFVTTTLAISMSLITGLIATRSIIICLIITVIGVLWIYLSSKQ